MLHQDLLFPQGSFGSFCFAGEVLGPCKIIFYEDDWGFMGLQFTNSSPLKLFLGHR